MEGFLSIDVSVTIVVALLLFSAMVSCALLVYIVTKSRSGRVMSFFISGQILIIIWTIFYIFEILAPTVEARWIIVCIEYFPLTFVGFSFMHFSYTYTRHEIMPKKWFYSSLVLPVLTYIGVLTNPLHYLFYYEFRVDGEVFGPITYLIIAITFVYLIIGAIFFLNSKHPSSITKQRQSMYFIIAMVIPITIHGLHTFGFVHFGFSVTLVFIPFSLLLCIVSVLKYQFLDVLPIAINDTIDSMHDGMIVVDRNGQIIDSNAKFFRRIFGITSLKSIKNMEEFTTLLRSAVTDNDDLDDLNEAIFKSSSDGTKATLKVNNLYQEEVTIYYTLNPIFDYSKQKMATLITFFDMTEIFELHEKLEEKNSELLEANDKLQKHIKTVQQLTMERERNTIMADVHDTLGHSMMELLTLLEVTDLMIDHGQEEVIEIISEALEKGRNSLTEVRVAVQKYKKMGGIS